MSQSNVAFDFLGNGDPVHTGWAGENTGFVVLDANGNSVVDNGSQMLTFAELATLDTNGDGIINADDPAFANLEVWVDANGDGVSQTDELFSLADLGILSISAAANPVTVDDGGNLITAVGTLTFTNGTTEAADQVTFATAGNGGPVLSGQSAAALSLLEQVSGGLVAQAAGTANAVAGQIPAANAALVTADNGLAATLKSAKKPKVDGYTLNPTQINIVTVNTPPTLTPTSEPPFVTAIEITLAGTTTTTIVTIDAPSAVRATLALVGQALTSVQTAADTIASASTAQETADSYAVVANTADAPIGSVPDTTAVQSADTAEAVWQTAFSQLVSSTTLLQTATSSLTSSQTVLNSIVLGTGSSYATTADAMQAADSFSEQSASSDALAFGEAAFSTLLSAAAQAWNASSAVVASAGSTLTAAGGGLIIAGAGSETVTDGSTASTYIVLPGAQIVLSNFLAGSGGSRLDFLASGEAATVTSVTGGTQISVGSASVMLAGVAASSLSLTDNLLGVGSASLTGAVGADQLVTPSPPADVGASQVRTVSGVTAANAVVVAGQSFSVGVSDTAAKVEANFPILEGLAVDDQLASVTFTDASTPSLSLSATQFVVDIDALAKITSSYNLTGVLATEAAAVAPSATTASFSIVDTAANVLANLDALQTLAQSGKLGTITLTDTGTPSLALTAAQSAADEGALAAINTGFSLTGVLAADATVAAAITHLVSLSVTDTAANVESNLDALEAVAQSGKLASITLTDPGSIISITAAQLTADAGALSAISGSYGLAVGEISATNAASVASQPHVELVSVVDTSANIVANKAALQSLSNSGEIGSISVSDANPTNLSEIYSLSHLAIAGVLAANAASIASQTNVFLVSVVDSVADVLANLAALQSLAAQDKIGSISLTDPGTPTVSVTPEQFVDDAAALGKLVNSFSLALTGPGAPAITMSAAQAASDAALFPKISGLYNAVIVDTAVGVSANFSDIQALITLNVLSFVSVVDTAASVLASLDALQTLAQGGKLGTITLTDSGTPSLALTAAQSAADEGALAAINTGFTLTGVLAADATAAAAITHLVSLSVTDTAANVETNLDALEAVAQSGKLASITLTDPGAIISITAAQLTADAGALAAISGSYGLAVGEISAANAASVASQPHVDLVSIVDTSANIAANKAALQSLSNSGKIGSISVSDANPTNLSEIYSLSHLAIAGVLAANAASIASQTNVFLVSVVDTVANVLANLAALETLAAQNKIGSISLTDPGTPTVSVTPEQFVDDAAALGKLVNSFSLAITGAGAPTITMTAAQATAAAAVFPKISGTYNVAITDTAANVSASVDALEALATAGIPYTISFTDSGTPVLSVTTEQLTADAAVFAKISGSYSLSVSGVTAASAAGVASEANVTTVGVSDSAKDVAAKIASLQMLAIEGELRSVSLTDSGTPTLPITALQAATDSAALSKVDDAYTLPCFVAGTLIRAARLEVRVEDLRKGDEIVLAAGGRAAVVWLGHRKIDCSRHPRPQDVWPVRVSANAFGAGHPHSDLLLSPDHAVFADGVLIPIKHLINGATIVQQEVAEVTYWHVELENHDVILAEGLPCESYLDTGNRAAFSNGGNVVMRDADFSRGVWETAAYAPLVIEGPARDRVHARLLRQAEALGWSRHVLSLPTLVVCGRELRPVSRTGQLHRFLLPPGTDRVCLRAENVTLAQAEKEAHDRPRPALAVAGVLLDGRVIPLEGNAFGKGFAMSKNGWRWAEGDGELSLPSRRGCVLEVQVAEAEEIWQHVGSDRDWSATTAAPAAGQALH